MISKPEITPLLPSDEEIEARAESLAVELAADLAANARARRRRPWHRRVLVALVAIPLIGVGVAGAAGVFSAKEMSIDAGMGCYSEASLSPEVIAIVGPREDPIAACAEMWRRGEIRRGVKRAPRLVACTGPDQPVRVMPGTVAVCERFGLVELPADYGAAAREWSPPADGIPRD